MALFMLSLTGMPVSAGLIGKEFVFQAAPFLGLIGNVFELLFGRSHLIAGKPFFALQAVYLTAGFVKPQV